MKVKFYKQFKDWFKQESGFTDYPWYYDSHSKEYEMSYHGWAARNKEIQYLRDKIDKLEKKNIDLMKKLRVAAKMLKLSDSTKNNKK